MAHISSSNSYGRTVGGYRCTSDLNSSSTASTEASLSENSSHGGQTPPKNRGALAEVWKTPDAHSTTCFDQSVPKRTRRSNRRKNKNALVIEERKAWESWECKSIEEHTIARREVVTVSDLCFDFGPTLLNGAAAYVPKATPAAFPSSIMEDYGAAPVSPCRTRVGPSGIVSTNPCVDVAPTVAPACTRTPKYQAAPTTLDLMLCSTSPEPGYPTTLPEAQLSSPCKGRSMGIVSSTPCNTPTGMVSASHSSNGIVSATPCNTPTANTRIADASARTPAPPTPDASARTPAFLASDLGIDQGPFSPIRPRALFAGPPEFTSQGPAGVVVADAMRSWLHSTGLPSGSAALAAELRAAVPETYED